jgi:crooked neck
VQKIQDAEELASYRMRKRKEYEDVIRRARQNMGAWTQYAKWEASQSEFDRARSIWERAIDVDYTNVLVWQKYVEMEMSNRFVNRARNIFDRVVALLPRVDTFWFKYSHMEEMLGNIDGARAVFERWMQWQPERTAWVSYIGLETRHDNFDRARQVFERYLVCHPICDTYLHYAAYEAKRGTIPAARHIFERCASELGESEMTEEFYLKFAAFEEKQKEFSRARAIYKFALDRLPKHRAEELYRRYTQFEKQCGDKDGLEAVIVQKRRAQYEAQATADPLNYDVWFDYCKLEESNGNLERIRDVYERAIANVPPVATKDAWRRYIYLWIQYALFEELIADDLERAQQVYSAALALIPHSAFTFGKMWLLAAQALVRRKDLNSARRLLGRALGTCAKPNIYKGYIELELQLGEVDRCRTLYQKFIEFSPHSCSAWQQFAELEKGLEEDERARAIFELAVSQSELDAPEQLWKAYIDFEIELGEFSNVRSLYDRLLERSKHVKVWISRAQFEAALDADEARATFVTADAHFKQQVASNPEMAEERVMLLDAWRGFEKQHGSAEQQKAVTDKMPKRVKKKRAIKAADGSDAGFEEYYDYLFPDESKASGTLKLLANVQAWKKRKLVSADSELPAAAEPK